MERILVELCIQRALLIQIFYGFRAVCLPYSQVMMPSGCHGDKEGNKCIAQNLLRQDETND